MLIQSSFKSPRYLAISKLYLKKTTADQGESLAELWRQIGDLTGKIVTKQHFEHRPGPARSFSALIDT
jgi:hypothetical protein